MDVEEGYIDVRKVGAQHKLNQRGILNTFHRIPESHAIAQHQPDLGDFFLVPSAMRIKTKKTTGPGEWTPADIDFMFGCEAPPNVDDDVTIPGIYDARSRVEDIPTAEGVGAE